MTLPVVQIHPEVLLGAGYAVLLLAAAYGLEWLARGAHRRSEAYELSGFAYHPDLDVWECPTGQHLMLSTVDHLRQLAHYRARPNACNSCPLKSQCTESDDGREIVRSQVGWPHSEVARFQRGLSLLLVGMAFFVIVVVGTRHATTAELGLLLGPSALAYVTGRRLWPAFRATRAGFN
ncbi:MAG: transposase [Chloroflexota bacterium]